MVLPVEAVYAAGDVPVDLCNAFIAAENRDRLLRIAEDDGFPRSACIWVKGIYGYLKENEEIRTVIATTGGTCTRQEILAELLKSLGVEVIPFTFPKTGGTDALRAEIERLCESLGTTYEAAEHAKERLDRARALVKKLDIATWRDNCFIGCENHRWQVRCTDFDEDPEDFARRLESVLQGCRKTDRTGEVRLAVLGSPPVADDFYEYIEEMGGRVVFNEPQWQYAMIPTFEGSLLDQYARYTYPFDIERRIEVISEEVRKRDVHGAIDCSNLFCPRSLEYPLYRDRLEIPVIPLEEGKDWTLAPWQKASIKALVWGLKGE
jgi:benzoyl-CoA reductase/2-hydroxyglutaryl-CoA dehydratase subunit BcrC/BadD/HgdB